MTPPLSERLYAEPPLQIAEQGVTLAVLQKKFLQPRDNQPSSTERALQLLRQQHSNEQQLLQQQRHASLPLTPLAPLRMVARHICLQLPAPRQLQRTRMHLEVAKPPPQEHFYGNRVHTEPAPIHVDAH